MLPRWEPGPSSGANSRVKSKAPLSPVRFTTARSTDWLKNDTNINFEVEILEPYTLERAVSKAKRVFDKRTRP